MTSIDINCDMGELADLAVSVQPSLMEFITSANIACGAHAGDAHLMKLTLRQAAACGVSVGAHPGYPDRANFGRLALQMPIAALEQSIEDQIRTLIRFACEEGVQVRYVKPHGALYNQAAHDLELARTIARAVTRVDARLAIFGLAGSPALTVWKDAGLPSVAEAFADRRYEADGSLRARRFADALCRTPEEAAEQALRIASQQQAVACDGSVIRINAETLCIHGDSPGAVEIARGVRNRLENAGIAVRPWQSAARLG